MFIFQFIDSEYKCPVYDDSNLFLQRGFSVFIIHVTDKSLIIPNALQASQAGGDRALLYRLSGFVTVHSDRAPGLFIL